MPDTDTDTSASAFRGATPGDTPTPTRPSFRAPETRDFHAGAVASRLASPAAEQASEQASDDLVEADLEHANAVTGIIPVVGDEPDGVSVVDADDVDSVELAAPPAPAGRTSAFAEVMDDDFEAYRAFADVEDDEEPKQKRRWFRRRGAKAAGRGAAAKAAADADGTDADGTDAEAPTVDKATGPDVTEPATADFPGDEAVALTPAATEQFSAADREEATDASPAPGTPASDAPALEDPAIEAEENTSMELVEDLLDVQPAADDVIADSEAPVPGTDTADVDDDVVGTESSSAAPIVDDVAAERVPTFDASAADTAATDTSVTETSAAEKTDTADTHAPDTHAPDTDTPDTDTADADTAPAKKGRFDSPLAAWLLVIGESIVGLAVGVGLFWGFTELWKWNVYFALVLAVLVIFGVVTLTHAVRRSRDLPTTLLALGVGLIVTIGPLVLLAT